MGRNCNGVSTPLSITSLLLIKVNHKLKIISCTWLIFLGRWPRSNFNLFSFNLVKLLIFLYLLVLKFKFHTPLLSMTISGTPWQPRIRYTIHSIMVYLWKFNTKRPSQWLSPTQTVPLNKTIILLFTLSHRKFLQILHRRYFNK